MSSTTAGWPLVQLLAEPTRRRIFDTVRAARVPVTREDVSASTGVSRRLAAFHLDQLAAAGLLSVDYARPDGRSGPGAGRPAKRYAAVPVDVEVSIPERRPDIAARILARAVDEADAGTDSRSKAVEIAAAEGERMGLACRRGTRLSTRKTLDAAGEALDGLGYEPVRDGSCIRLRNCPFHAVVEVAPQLVCGINVALVDGILRGIGGAPDVQARLEGERPDCCVTVAAR
jgi:predicted ArsR family transcriptional regulator